MATSPSLPLLLLLLLTSKCDSQSDSDFQTLLTIKQDCGNPPALSSWETMAATAHCSWLGVTCTNGNVTALSLPNLHIGISNPFPSVCKLQSLSRLNLSYNNFTGHFPTALYDCAGLKVLDLSNNAFDGALPPDIGASWPRLQHLNLSSNSFTGDVPPAIAQLLPKLRSLVLDTNMFDGSYPASDISELAGLEMLTLASNPFLPAAAPEEFGKLTNVTYLWLSNMSMTGEIPASLARLEKVTLFDLSMNKLQGTIPAWVWQLEKVEYLYLYMNNLTGEIAPNVMAMNLVEIDVSGNGLTGPIPDDFGKLKNLTVLFLYDNQLTGPIPASIGLLPTLHDIRLFNNNLSGGLPPELGKHSPLKNLEVSNNNLSGQLPESLCANQKLYDIVVFNNNFSGPLPSSLDGCHLLQNMMLYNNKLTGDFPTSLWSATNQLSVVMIQNNKLSGVFPTKLPWNLTRLEIDNNRFSGPIPTLTGKMKILTASNNNLSGEIPWELMGVWKLTALDLSRNRISGSIPVEIGVLHSLVVLNLSGNQITGEIPNSIGLLEELIGVDLSENMLSGEIPEAFDRLNLNFLNLSVNYLTGEVPSSLQSQAYDKSFLSNPGLCTSSKHSVPYLLTCTDPSNSRNEHTIILIIILVSVLATTVLVGTALNVFFTFRRRIKQPDQSSWTLTSFHVLDFTEHDVLGGLCEQNFIGSGGSGKVFQINIINDMAENRMVAVKKIGNIQRLDENLEKEFLAESKILGAIRHGNIVKLLCCITSSHSKLLVYEYMENSSLDRWLHHRQRLGTTVPPLDWPTRLRIAIDAARGLCYMHHNCSPPIVHRDVKPSNILLDMEFRAKIADFGLARILAKATGEPESVSAIGGTFGYMPPEYVYQRKVNEKVDVYSFGVVLLELITGKVANGGGADYCLAEWAWRQYQECGFSIDLVDEDIKDPAFLADMTDVFTIGLICTGEQSSSRPSMKVVLQGLLRVDRASRSESLHDTEYDEEPFLEISEDEMTMSDSFDVLSA